MGNVFSWFAEELRIPIINDVATNLEDPPSFVRATWIGPLPDRFKPKIKAYYTKLNPLSAQGRQPEDVFDVALTVASTTPLWRITHEDKSAGIIEGVATTPLLKFKDDFVIRVRAFADGTTVDMRSKSRIGKGDHAANAKRIMAYLAKLENKLSP